MTYSIVPREMTIAIHPEGETHDYERTMQIQKCGERGVGHSLSGKGFYALLKRHGTQPFKDSGLERVTVAIEPAHVALIQRELAGISIRDDGPCLDWPSKRWYVITEAQHGD